MRHAWQLAGAALTVWLVAGSGLGWGAVYYVDGDGGDDAHGGTSWADAYQTLTNALAQAAGVSEIWVKAGVYTPTADGNRTKSFVMKTGVDLYGGFDGTETALEERDWTNNLTVLSGDIGAAGDMSDNSYHVVTGATARIDGFTIREGRADGTATSQKSGGGMYTVGAYPITANCIFSNNTSTNSGSSISAVYWDQGSYTACTVGWYNCTFVGNTNSGALYLNIWTNAAGAISNRARGRKSGRRFAQGI